VKSEVAAESLGTYVFLIVMLVIYSEPMCSYSY